MELNSRLWHEQLQTIFSKKYIYNINGYSGDIVSEISEQIKRLLDAKCVAIYLYDSWKDDFALATDLPEEQSMLKQYLIEDAGLDKFTYETVKQGYNIFKGNNLFKETVLYRTFLIPLNKDELPLGFILISFPNLFQITEENLIELEGIAHETFQLLNGLGSYTQTKEKANKYELLYRVTKKFHSSINTHDVLTEVINTLSSVYPKLEYNLFLSQDYQHDSDLPIKSLIYNDKFVNSGSVQAFLTGKIQLEKSKCNTKSHFYAPLKGKQGIYGVLQVTAPNTSQFPDSDIEFITLLANTAGNALENAQLYQQSKQLISDLQLINETSHTLNSKFRLIEITEYMNKQIKQSFKAEEVGFFLFSDEKDQVLEGSTSFFFTNQSALFASEINESLKKTKESMFVGDFQHTYNGKVFPFYSFLAIPMIQTEKVIGAIMVLHHTSNYFSFESFKLIRSLVHHSTLAFVNSMLREQLEHLVITDYLSQLYSRKYLDEKLQEYISIDNQGVFLLVDIDDFKKFNDTYGHEVGDDIIVQVATIIKDSVVDKGFAARWGGEELAIYLPMASLEDGLTTAEQLVYRVRENTNPTVTISVGVSYWNNETEDSERAKTIFDFADSALYEAKRLGKNCVVQG
ncbi:sensor domain-containing diguanylate cyclase [Aquibacillus kalidii]|uniref:sensor domain-containing diguanylate cyclase n=1 Tax=Aquibacillus kalidii TaxID=2762597 RepID=UPI001645E6B0|nr:diguanylate cyclase [Aquibacillus kalidii]